MLSLSGTLQHRFGYKALVVSWSPYCTPHHAVCAAVQGTEFNEEDDEVVALIKVRLVVCGAAWFVLLTFPFVQELLETRIRPAVQEDGGDIFFV